MINQLMTSDDVLNALFGLATWLHSPELRQPKPKSINFEANTDIRPDGTLVVHWKQITKTGKRHISVRDNYETQQTFWDEVESIKNTDGCSNTVTVRGKLVKP